MIESQHKANNTYRKKHYKCVSFYVDRESGEYEELMK